MNPSIFFGLDIMLFHTATYTFSVTTKFLWKDISTYRDKEKKVVKISRVFNERGIKTFYPLRGNIERMRSRGNSD